MAFIPELSARILRAGAPGSWPAACSSFRSCFGTAYPGSRDHLWIAILSNRSLYDSCHREWQLDRSGLGFGLGNDSDRYWHNRQRGKYLR